METVHRSRAPVLSDLTLVLTLCLFLINVRTTAVRSILFIFQNGISHVPQISAVKVPETGQLIHLWKHIDHLCG